MVTLCCAPWGVEGVVAGAEAGWSAGIVESCGVGMVGVLAESQAGTVHSMSYLWRNSG